MKTVNEIKQKIEELRNEYRELNMEFPSKDNPDNNILINQLLSDLVSQIRILEWVLGDKDNELSTKI